MHRAIGVWEDTPLQVYRSGTKFTKQGKFKVKSTRVIGHRGKLTPSKARFAGRPASGQGE